VDERYFNTTELLQIRNMNVRYLILESYMYIYSKMLCLYWQQVLLE
jgi:hypothetical protein